MARMDRMIIVHLWGMRVKRNSKRARKKTRIKLPGRRLTLCVNGVNNDFRSFFFTLVRGRGVDV